MVRPSASRTASARGWPPPSICEPLRPRVRAKALVCTVALVKRTQLPPPPQGVSASGSHTWPSISPPLQRGCLKASARDVSAVQLAAQPSPPVGSQCTPAAQSASFVQCTALSSWQRPPSSQVSGEVTTPSPHLAVPPGGGVDVGGAGVLVAVG